MTEEQAVGIYSKKAAELYGTTVWLTPDGHEVEITAKDKPSSYKWDDAQIIGPVEKWVRSGCKGEVKI